MATSCMCFSEWLRVVWVALNGYELHRLLVPVLLGVGLFLWDHILPVRFPPLQPRAVSVPCSLRQQLLSPPPLHDPHEACLRAWAGNPRAAFGHVILEAHKTNRSYSTFSSIMACSTTSFARTRSFSRKRHAGALVHGLLAALTSLYAAAIALVMVQALGMPRQPCHGHAM